MMPGVIVPPVGIGKTARGPSTPTRATVGARTVRAGVFGSGRQGAAGDHPTGHVGGEPERVTALGG
jgi:hypothetical protein